MKLFVTILIFALPVACFAVEDDEEDVIILHSGEVYQGVILKRSPDSILLSTRQYEVRSIDPSQVKLHRLDRSAASEYSKKQWMGLIVGSLAGIVVANLVLEDNPETGVPDFMPYMGVGCGVSYLVGESITMGTYKPSRKKHLEHYLERVQLQVGAPPSSASMNFAIRF